MQRVDDRCVFTQGLTAGAEEGHLLDALRKVSLLREHTHRNGCQGVSYGGHECENCAGSDLSDTGTNDHHDAREPNGNG